MATGLDANGNLLPGYRYVTYHDGVGQGTPINVGEMAQAAAPGSTMAQLGGMVPQDFASTPNPYQQQMQQVAARTSPASTFGPPQGANQPQRPMMPQIPQFGFSGSATQMGMNRPWNMGGMERNPFAFGGGMGGMFGMPYRMGQMGGFGQQFGGMGGPMFGRTFSPYQSQQFSFGGMGGPFMGRQFGRGGLLG